MNAPAILSESYARLNRGDPLGAERTLAALWNAGPAPPPPAVHLLGLIRRAQGRIGDAELLMRQSIADDPKNAEYRNNLGLLLRAAGFTDPAIAVFEEALALNPGLSAARLNLARALNAAGRHVDAEQAARALIAQSPGAAAWTVLGGALRQQGRFDEALDAFDRALALDPNAMNARHDRAVALDKAGRGDEAITVFAQLHAEGLSAPQLFLNWASALMDRGQAHDAEARLAEGVRRHPADPTLHASLSKMRWLNGDAAGFARDFLAAVDARADDIALRLGCADMLRRADRHDEAEALLRAGLARAPGDALLATSLGVLRGEAGDIAEALPLLERGVAARPDDFALRESLASAFLQAGAPDAALGHIRIARAKKPLDCAWIAHEAVALRMKRDRAYGRLYDMDRIVRVYNLATPPGYADYATFNAALADALRRLHTLDAHPLDQSLRHGTQTSKSLLDSRDPVIRAFLAALEAPIADYIAAMPDDAAHPIHGRKPKSGRAKLVGCWSVRLRPGGYHVNHVHPEGWISSAYYVAVPPGVAGADDHQGWIQFGEPRWPVPGVTAERYVEPRAGRLVLFPSCLWHGTVPFRDGEERLTIAFDAVPD